MCIRPALFECLAASYSGKCSVCLCPVLAGPVKKQWETGTLEKDLAETGRLFITRCVFADCPTPFWLTGYGSIGARCNPKLRRSCRENQKNIFPYQRGQQPAL